ncbi:MAG: bifunctional phosphopantothenoylcysteine decarboxylase/phosphopantothenate--cysteine ligase CoaBC [Alphaproteobacteria bacterium]|nr:bifunctional phosphopantothenoylcysteine decarboxylase/phosphopantothenate--cysteine ligase CoaBC [Alphaproteobacteria bacterium]
MNSSPFSFLSNKNILLIISGGIAAYKSLELIRRLRDQGCIIRTILTKHGAEFITPLSITALSHEKVYSDLFSLTDENEMGHIRLSREADLILIAPATANIMAKIAHGIADDLATTVVLASNKPVALVPSMNSFMWDNPVTQDNIHSLQKHGKYIINPQTGDLACGEKGMGRMAEIPNIIEGIKSIIDKPILKNKISAFVTAGPTRELIDSVRFISNYSSGKQGLEIAKSLAKSGIDTTLIMGPTTLEKPAGIKTIFVETADQMLDACLKALPVDISIFTAAVADWKVAHPSGQKIKKEAHAAPPTLHLIPNPDILKQISFHQKRPKLVIGFAAETENVIANAKLKKERKKCDWVLANDVSIPEEVFGNDNNQVYFISNDEVETWPRTSKKNIADQLVQRIFQHLNLT